MYWARAALFGSAALCAFACTTEYQQGLEDPNYGNPNTLAGKKPPGPSLEVAGEQNGGGAPTQPLCVQKGGTILTTLPTCAVTFKGDVLTALSAGGCQAVGTCHGGATPKYPPKIDPADPVGTYNAMATLTPSTGKPYINPCSIDPTAAVMDDNIDPNAPATDRGQSMPPGAGLAAAVPKVVEWLKCGSPNN